jgi:hypothetical protein
MAQATKCHISRDYKSQKGAIGPLSSVITGKHSMLSMKVAFANAGLTLCRHQLLRRHRLHSLYDLGVVGAHEAGFAALRLFPSLPSQLAHRKAFKAWDRRYCNATEVQCQDTNVVMDSSFE